jgi:excisionase family DNA binding protein
MRPMVKDVKTTSFSMDAMIGETDVTADRRPAATRKIPANVTARPRHREREGATTMFTPASQPCATPRVLTRRAELSARGDLANGTLTLIYHLPYICVMELSVRDVALQRGVSSRRVLQLIASGEINARRVGGQWLVEQRELLKRPRLARPMSHKMAWAFIQMVSGQEVPDLDPTERLRLRVRMQEMISRSRAGEDVAPQLSSLLRDRAREVSFRVEPGAVQELREDKRLLLSGISDPRSRMSAGEEIEAYVRPAHLDSLISDWFLIEQSTAPSNVLLHVADIDLSEVPVGLIIADLADRGRPREDGEVERLLAMVQL